MSVTYKVKIGKKEFEVEVDEVAPNKYKVRIDKYEVEVLVRKVEKEIPKVERKTKETTKNLATTSKTLEIPKSASTITIPRPAVKKAPKAVKGYEIKASIPGKVLRVLVKPGDKIDSRTAIITLESMKMELEIHAGREGVVREVRVKPGDTVNTGDVIAIIE